jgi:hypothetical protein
MATQAALRRAHRAIAHVLRGQVASVRAVMEFDVRDPGDVRSWINYKIGPTEKVRYSGPDWRVVRALVSDALSATTKALRLVQRKPDGTPVPLAGDLAMAALPAKPEPEIGWQTAIEVLACAASRAALSLVLETPQSAQMRRTAAVLSCLARLIAAGQKALPPGQESALLSGVAAQPAFRALSLTPAKRRRFLDAVGSIQITGNGRQDLYLAGLPWAQGKQWQEFTNAFDRHRSALELEPKPSLNGEIAW